MAVANLIINADDFGLSCEISDAIAKGHDNGIITSTTLMATAPATEYAAKLAKLRPDLGVGIHLNITTGRTLIDSDKLLGLVDGEGHFLGPNRAAKRLSFDLRLIGPISEEYSRQVERCLALGINPTHCDTHHGMHRFPIVFEAFQRTLLRYGIKAARSQVCLVIQAKPSGNPPGGGPDIRLHWDRGLKAGWRRLCVRRLHTSGIQTPDALLRADVSGLGKVTPLEWFNFLVRHAPPGTFEIVLHPGMLEEDGSVSSRSLEIRRRDTALVEQRPSERFPGTSVRFISYARIARLPRWGSNGAPMTGA